jgi:hypothetical protein
MGSHGDRHEPLTTHYAHFRLATVTGGQGWAVRLGMATNLRALRLLQALLQVGVLGRLVYESPYTGQERTVTVCS